MEKTKNILETIVERKRVEVAALPSPVPDGALLGAALARRGDLRPFVGALSRPRRPGMALIAEVKKASPSAGVIRADFDPVRIAREYEAAGADCLSVLTDETFFQGSLSFLKAIRAAVGLPLLRKDFIIDERQILEAVEWGADAVLLIVAILDDARLERFLALASGAGLGVLVEVHDAEELARALRCGATLIGVNNRDLRSFTVDLATTERLAAALAGDVRAKEKGTLLVAESGIHSRADVMRLQACGAAAVLVGESLMRHADLGVKVRELMGA